MPHEHNHEDGRLQRLAAFLPTFENPGSRGDGPRQSSEEENNKLVSTDTGNCPDIGLFLKLLYSDGWILIDFDWAAWKATDEAITLRDEPGAIEHATAHQLAKLLTTIVRQDRFVDGALNHAIESHLVTRILHRAKQLAEAS